VTGRSVRLFANGDCVHRGCTLDARSGVDRRRR
jgi:hypothetical protein